MVIERACLQAGRYRAGEALQTSLGPQIIQYVVDVKRYAFTDSLRRFDETVIAAADGGRAAKIVVYARHSFSLGTHRRCDSGLHTISQSHVLYYLCLDPRQYGTRTSTSRNCTGIELEFEHWYKSIEESNLNESLAGVRISTSTKLSVVPREALAPNKYGYF